MSDFITSPPKGPETPKEVPKQDMNTIELQLDRFYRARDAMMPWSLLATECVDFAEGRQITEQEKRDMLEEGRPIITLNKIAMLLRLVKGYFRQNRTMTSCKPGNDGVGMQGVADALNMLMAQLDEMNGSAWNHADVFYDGLMGGRGYFDTRLDFEANIFGQIKETTKDPFSVYPDPEGIGYDPNTWTFVQSGTWMSITDIREIFGPNAAALIDSGIGMYGSFPVRGDGGLTGTEMDVTPARSFGLSDADSRSFDSQYFGAVQSYNLFDHLNKDRRLIRILECQHKVWTRGPFLIDLITGDKRPIPLHWTRQRIGKLEEFCRSRNMPMMLGEGTYKRNRWTVTAADRIIYDDWSLYRDFTITPYFPYFRRGITRGMVEDLLDPQREINKRRSNMLHILTTMAHSGWMWEEGALTAEAEEMLEAEGARPGINLKYTKGFKEPQRIMPGIPSRGHELAGTSAEEDLKEIAGINDSALGQVDVVQSGRAVEARQRQAVVGLEEYFDNWDRTMEMKGRIRLNIIQDYYTEPRIIRSRGDDGKDQMTMINAADSAGNIINNVSVGTYAIAVDKMPLAATFKDAQFQEAMAMRKEGVPVPDDVLVDLSTMPGKEKIKARLTEAYEVQRAQMGLPPSPGSAPPGGAQPSSATSQPVPSPAPGQGALPAPPPMGPNTPAAAPQGL